MLPVLYNRRADKSIQTWQVEVVNHRYRFISGVLNGAKTKSEWTVAQPKNAGRANQTNPAQQAELEARSHWQKKHDAGYRESVGDIDTPAFFKPMLAATYDKTKPMKFPVYLQPKLDGQRCIANRAGLWSRNGKPVVAAPHIVAALKPLFERYPDLILDGELYAHSLCDDFNAIMSLTRKAKPTPKDIAASAAMLDYHVYDCLINGLGRGPFSKRHAALTNLFRQLRQNFKPGQRGCIIGVETVEATTRADVDHYYEKWVSEEYEGQMIRLDKPYEQKRSKHLLKMKEFDDSEFTIRDVLEGDGNRSKMAGRLLFRNAANKPFKANIKGDRNYYRELLKNKAKYIGRTATVKYFGLTPDGIPRFPVVTKIGK